MLTDNKPINKQDITLSSIRVNNPSSQRDKKNMSNSRKDSQDIDSSHRKFLKLKNLGQVNSENFNNLNKNNDDINSLSNSQETFVERENLMYLDKSEMRKVKKTIPERNWFKNITYIIIILNTIKLILQTYPEKFWFICNICDYVFTICFIIEMSIKIAFFGFIRNAKSYLRQTPLNILDFLITIGCTVNIILNILSNIKKSEGFPKMFKINTNYSNFSEFRLFSLLLFPLDHQKTFYNVNFYLLNIKHIFLNLSNIAIFIIFLYLFFSLIGLGLWRGRFSFLCHTQTQPINKNNFPLVGLFLNNFCGGSNNCNTKTDFCLSSKEFYKNGLLEKSVYQKEIDHTEFNYGITKFNNIFRSLLTIFISSTGDGWEKIMSMAMDAHNYWISYVLFLIMESAFFLVIKNAVLIIILLTFEKGRILTERNTEEVDISTDDYSNQLLKNSNSMKYIKKNYSPIKKPDQTYIAKINKVIKQATHNYKRNFCTCNESKTSHEKKLFIRRLASIVYQQNSTKIICGIFIIFNIIIVLIEYVPGNDYITKELSKKSLNIFVLIKLIIVIIYCIEQFIILLSIGPLKMISSFFYCTDFIFSVLTISKFFYDYNHKNPNPSITLGIFRIFKFYNPGFYNNNYLKMIISSVTLVIRRSIYIIPIFVVFLLTFSLFGFSLFHDSITFNEFGDYDENSKNNEINFNDFTNSLFSTFLILLQHDWVSLFYLCYRSDKNSAPLVLIFYILIVIFGQFILMNMVLSFLFEQYHYYREKFENNFDTKNNMICMQLEYTKYYQIDKLIHEKRRDYETIIKNLLKMNKKLVNENKEMILVGNSKINFIKNSVKLSENFYKFHSNILKTHSKEILIGVVFDNYLNENYNNKKDIKRTKFWNFNLKYTQGYIERMRKTRKKKSVEQFNNTKSILNSKISNFRRNSLSKQKELNKENHVSFNSIVEKINNKEGIRRSTKKRTTIVPKFRREELENENSLVVIDEIDNKSVDYNMKDLRKKIRRKLIRDRRLRKRNSHILPEDLLDEEDVVKMEKEKNKSKWQNLKNRSLFIFHWKNKFRIYVTNLTSLREFNYIITFLILVHSVVLWFDTPFIEQNSSQKHLLDKFNFYLSIAFIIEGILKIIRFGFIIKEDSRINIRTNASNFKYFLKYLNELNIQNFEENTEKEQIKVVTNFMSNENNQAYLGNPYNVIDFICIIVSLIDMLNVIQEGILLTFLRAIRSIKPIRFINSSDELRFIMKVFISSLLDVLIVLFMLIFYMVVISILGQTLFKDKANFKCTLGFKYLNEYDCVQNGGYWVRNTNNFSNFLNSFKTSFEVIMGENLGKIMEETYLLTNIYWTYPFFVIAEIIGNIFVLKLLLAVIIQSFRKIQKHDDPYNNLTNPEKVWLKIQSEMSQYNPNMNIQFETKKNPHTKKFIKIISNKKFQKIYLILVIVDIILYMLKYEDASYIYLNIINYLNILVTILLNVKVILNFMAYSFSSLNKKWHIFELIVTIVGDIALILEIIKNHLDDRNRDILTFSQNLIEILNIARILRLLSLNNYFKETSSLFFSILPRLTSIAVLLLIILMVYANLGTIIFGLLPYRTYINSNNNFGNSFNSLMMLFQVLTGSEWNMIMYEMAFHDCRNHSSIEYQSDYYCVFYNVTCFFKDGINHTFLYHLKEHRDNYSQNYILNLDIRNNINAYHLYCGSNGSYIYIISFIVICSILIMSLVVVFVLDSYEKSYQMRKSKKKGRFMIHILKVWHKYDLTYRSLLNPQDFVLLLKEIPPPFGFNYDRLISSNPLKSYKKRKEFLIFKNNLKNQQKNGENIVIQYNDSEFNKKYTGLPYSYQFNNFYIEHDVKFFTDDIEMLKILNYLDLIAFVDKSRLVANQTNTYIFKNDKLMDIIFDDNYVHYIDMCMAISKLITSRTEGVNINSLRENFVNSYSVNKWVTNFNSNEVVELLNLKEVPITYRIINKLSNQMLTRAEYYYKVKQKKYFKKEHSNRQNDFLQKFGLILPSPQRRKSLREQTRKSKVIKVFTRTTSRGSYILIPNNMLNINIKKKNIRDRKKSDADAFKDIKKVFGKK